MVPLGCTFQLFGERGLKMLDKVRKIIIHLKQQGSAEASMMAEVLEESLFDENPKRLAKGILEEFEGWAKYGLKILRKR